MQNSPNQAKSAIEIIGVEKIAELRANGWIVIHREPTESMCKAFYADNWPEDVVFSEGYHRAVATSIREQNNQTTRTRWRRTQIHPEQAVSNISEWVRALGFEPPNCLKKQRVDKLAKWLGALLLIGGITFATFPVIVTDVAR